MEFFITFYLCGEATLLGNTAPLWVALFAWLVFREKLRGLFWVGLACALAGAAVVLGSDFIRHPSMGLGDMLALAAGVFYAGYFLVTERARKKQDTLSYVWMVDLVAAITLLIISLHDAVLQELALTARGETHHVGMKFPNLGRDRKGWEEAVATDASESQVILPPGKDVDGQHRSSS